MKNTLLAILIIVSSLNSFSQDQKNSLHGKVQDPYNNILPGASIVIVGSKYGVNANDLGEYIFDQLSTGRIRVQASFVGFKTKIVEVDIQPGQNNLNFTFEKEDVNLNGITVTSQKREQQIIDVPITMNVINARFIEDNHITQLDNLSEFVPGLQIRMQGADRPSIVMRGLTSDEVSPNAQPRVSVFYNEVPISRASGASVALFDMQQIDILKGPQGTLFGRGAQIGAIHFISNKPTNDFNGFIETGIGGYNQKEINGSINVPIIKNRLLVRAAGTYDYQDGYIKNTFDGYLNGKNTVASRFSASYIPSNNNKIDFVFNYQRDDEPGLGFMSMKYPNSQGSKNPFDYVSSLEQGKNLGLQRNILDATITAKHVINENNSWVSITSYRRIDAYSRWDGDGTAAAAIDMSEDDGARQVYQEIRYNYSIKSKLNGSIGSSYWNEKVSQKYWFSPNEQDMFHLFFNTGYLVTPDGQPYPVTNLPNDPQLGPLAGMALVTNHQEENKSHAVNEALESFADANYQLTSKFSITGGIRIISEWFDLKNEAQMTGGSPSTLGYLTGNYPNLFFKPSPEKEIRQATFAFTYRLGLKYAFNENSNIYAGYSKGRRPKVLQFTSAGEKQILDAETVNSFDLGYKTAFNQRLWVDVGLFYQSYLNFQTSAWVADPSSGEFNYIVKDGGKASAYGSELNVKYSFIKELQFFGNYAYIHARFAEKDIDGEKQAYANNMFRLTPEHSFAVGLSARVEISKGLFLFGVPSYSYKTKIFFEDANTSGLEQNGYGMLNFRGGVEYKNITIAIYGNNLLDEKYIVSAGNTGSLFGDPTQIPGVPRIIGTNLSWRF
jgi:iron complex outermembrane recepter protein